MAKLGNPEIKCPHCGRTVVLESHEFAYKRKYNIRYGIVKVLCGCPACGEKIEGWFSVR